MGKIIIAIKVENGFNEFTINEDKANFSDIGAAITQLELAKTKLLGEAAKLLKQK